MMMMMMMMMMMLRMMMMMMMEEEEEEEEEEENAFTYCHYILYVRIPEHVLGFVAKRKDAMQYQSRCRSQPGLSVGKLTFLLLLCCPLALTLSKDKHFKHDIVSSEQETGEKFELHSQGKLAQIVDLDTMPEVKVS
jgi:hypothetical protein